jgi:polysaccharide pyruvyl transferase WcaK-like protein
MKALLVGDNRSNNNWGGRGAGIALHHLLSKKFEISGGIFGSASLLEAVGSGYVNPLLHPGYNGRVLDHGLLGRTRRKLFDWRAWLGELWDAKNFIMENPAASVDYLLRHRHNYPRMEEIYRLTDDADLLVVNGEGDMVFTTPPRRETLFLLAMTELGLRLGKRVAFVNSMISDCPLTGRNAGTFRFAHDLLSKCDAVSVRDSFSFSQVRDEMPGVNCELIPDTLFSWFPVFQTGRAILPKNGDFIIPYPERPEYLGRLDFSKPYVCIGGSALAATDREKAVKSYTRLVSRFQQIGCSVYLTENDGRDSFLDDVRMETGVGVVPVYTSIFMAGAVLANARLFVSGRYHPSILASLGGTPCIFLGSTAHKMESLRNLLEYENGTAFSAFPSEAEADEILALGNDYLSRGEVLRDRVLLTVSRRCQESERLPSFISERCCQLQV